MPVRAESSLRLKPFNILASFNRLPNSLIIFRFLPSIIAERSTKPGKILLWKKHRTTGNSVSYYLQQIRFNGYGTLISFPRINSRVVYRIWRPLRSLAQGSFFWLSPVGSRRYLVKNKRVLRGRSALFYAINSKSSMVLSQKEFDTAPVPGTDEGISNFLTGCSTMSSPFSFSSNSLPDSIGCNA